MKTLTEELNAIEKKIEHQLKGLELWRGRYNGDDSIPAMQELAKLENKRSDILSKLAKEMLEKGGAGE